MSGEPSHELASVEAVCPGAPDDSSLLPKRTKCIDAIEASTQRAVGIDFSELEANGKFHEQEASPLFSILPRELRDAIWAYATAQSEDANSRFEKTAYFYRPGHTACLRTDIALLLTCRRVWLEANAFPMLQAEHSFYYHRAAPDARGPEWMGRLTEHNRRNFGHLHMFAQMFAIEGLASTPGNVRRFFLHTPLVPGDFQPRMLHVTIRHTDWWYWENDDPLRLEDRWVKALLDSPDLRSTATLRLELETLDYKVAQLQPILDRIQRMESEEKETHLIDGKPTKTKFVLSGAPESYDWEGPADIDKRKFGPYDGKAMLKYHVVTLTWKLRFPEIPGAFVPQLRRAPRIQGFNPWRNVHNREMQVHYPLAYSAPGVPGVLKRGLKRAANKGHVDAQGAGMRHVEKQVRRISQEQAESVESHRRAEHVSLNTDVWTKGWHERWQAEKSLLKFVD